MPIVRGAGYSEGMARTSDTYCPHCAERHIIVALQWEAKHEARRPDIPERVDDVWVQWCCPLPSCGYREIMTAEDMREVARRRGK